MRIKGLFRIAALATGLVAGAGAASAAEIVVGGKNFTEQQLMAEMTSRLLAENGFSVDKRAGLGTAPLRQAQEAGQIDVYWEYTGTSLITFNKVEERMDAAQTYETVKRLDAEKGLVWLDPSAANNTYAFAMRRADAEEKGIAAISDLAGKVNAGEDVSFASNAEFYARADGLGPLEETYGFSFGRANIVRMDTGLVYQALRDEQVDVGLVFATDGRIPAFDFVVLADDLGYFPAYALTPVVRAETLEANPSLADLLNALSAELDDATMARLNAAVDVDKRSVEDVAASFLQEEGLI
ncbi:glycine betaine ABC transporter substrate-binding protein [Salinarimonas sp.]|uniref:glycine betaine ABC transporter substrate-binding protein n=1 Tax=Salinarimonas sp. TaxID=2766526 RepID=UPI0032D93EDC